MSSNPYSASQPSQETKAPSSVWKERVLTTGVLLLTAITLVGLLIPATRRAGPVARRIQCANNLKQIGLALHNYASDHGCFPPAFTVAENGDRLHSWRTLLLPYLEQRDLYDRIHLDKPWNDPANEEARSTALQVYRCPEAKTAKDQTNYQIIVAPNAFLQPNARKSIASTTDGLEKILLVFESEPSQSVHWMSPADLPLEAVQNKQTKSKSIHELGRNAVFVDGHVAFLPYGLPAEEIKAMVSFDEANGANHTPLRSE